MYFFTEDERKIFLRKMLPKARKMEVDDELRGWSWHMPPLEPVYEEFLAVYEVSNAYCPTGRDLYIRRVLKQYPKPNYFMITGKALHEIILNVIVNAKKNIYTHGTYNTEELLASLRSPLEINWPKDMAFFDAARQKELIAKGTMLRDYEQGRIVARVGEILTQQPYIGADSLVHLALPVVGEHKLDGRFLGLSQHLSTDALILSEPMIVDLKFGAPQRFHRLATTGYAMVMEALYEMPVNLGCIIYGEFKNGRLLVTKDMHLIDDELRQWFVESRDEKMRMICEEVDPGIADGCKEYCPSYNVCHG